MLLEDVLDELVQYEKLMSHPNDWLEQSEWMEVVKNIELLDNENYGNFLKRHQASLEIFRVPNYNIQKLNLNVQQTMSVGMKKRSECSLFMPVIKEISDKTKITRIVDIGGGKGTLCRLLKDVYNFNDCVVVEGQTPLCDKAKKCDLEVINCWIQENTLGQIIDKDCIISALHTCGDLSPWILKSYCTNPNVKGLLHSPCCYHKTSNDYIPLSFKCKQLCDLYGFTERIKLLSTKNIASHATITWKTEDDILKWLSKLEYRTRFKAECHLAGYDYSNEVFHPISGILKKLKFSNYEEYKHYFISSLSLPPVPTVTFDPFIIRKLHIAYLIRFIVVGQLVEYLFLKDRQQYLIENGFNCQLLRLFQEDSPRCHVLYAVKE